MPNPIILLNEFMTGNDVIHELFGCRVHEWRTRMGGVLERLAARIAAHLEMWRSGIVGMQI